MKSREIQSRAQTTCEERYGHKFATQVPMFKEKSKMTMIKHHGVEHALQSPKIMRKLRKKYKSPKYPGKLFDSKWEIKLYDFLMEHQIDFTYQPQITFDYEYDNKVFKYHPDFLVNDVVYEVKGDHFFKRDDTGTEIMICPYGKRKMSEEEYGWLCGKFNAKYQCMLKNGVVILRGRDMKNLNNIFGK